MFCNAIVMAAVNAGHDAVSAEDVAAGREQYSHFAFEALRVENGVYNEDFESVLYAFIGATELLSVEDVRGLLLSADVSESNLSQVLDRLVELGFLGVEVRDDEYEFIDEAVLHERVLLRARSYAVDDPSGLHLKVHPAYSPYLGVES
jgi:hypothetical protein